MLSPAAMRKLRIFVLERDLDEVTRRLGRLGIVHLRSSVEGSEGLLEPERLGDRIDRCRRLSERVEELLAALDIPAGRARGPEPESLPPVEHIQALVDTLSSAVERDRSALQSAREALRDTEETLEELAPLKDAGGSLRPLMDSDLVEARAGTVARGELGPLRAAMPQGALIVPLEGARAGGERAFVLAVGARRRRFAMETALAEHGFEQKELPPLSGRTPAEVYREVLARRQELEGRVAALRRELRARGRPHAPQLQQAGAALDMHRKILSAQQQFATTWATAVISGWVPTKKVDELRAAVEKVTGGQAVIEVERPDREDLEAGRVPSYVVNRPFLAPFERLVNGYGVASYTELEPTALFAATFLLMVGLIFGDLGHGLLLLGIGLALKRKARGGLLRDLGHVVAVAGGASALFGTFFQGSFFGKSLSELGFPLTLGLEPLTFEAGASAATHAVIRYIALSLALGAVLISLGSILNVLNCLRRGDLEEGLLGRFGGAGLVSYWGAMAVGLKLALVGRGPTDAYLAGGLVVAPLALVALREPLYNLLGRGRVAWEEGALMGLMGGLIEALETVITYAANTFSFLRVAAFALSHCALSYTIFVLLDVVDDLPGGAAWAAIVFVAGTAFVIGMEGLIVGIQVVRLEYYEFFTKFFRGEGVRYEPFRLQ